MYRFVRLGNGVITGLKIRCQRTGGVEPARKKRESIKSPISVPVSPLSAVKCYLVADIIDPHGFHLADALPKLKGLARYAETHSQSYRRIEAVAKRAPKMRMLDLIRADVRQAVMEASSAEALYKGVRYCTSGNA